MRTQPDFLGGVGNMKGIRKDANNSCSDRMWGAVTSARRQGPAAVLTPCSVMLFLSGPFPFIQDNISFYATIGLCLPFIAVLTMLICHKYKKVKARGNKSALCPVSATLGVAHRLLFAPYSDSGTKASCRWCR